jgi:capsular exopolysaccharide synthesis family protein
VRLHDRLDVIRRRKWTVLLAVIIVPAAAIAYSLHQPARYSARADVLLGQPSSVQSVSGSTSDILAVQDPQRVVDTETALAREPEVAHRVVTSLGLGDRTAEEFLAQSSVSAQTDTNLLSFEVNDRSRRDAVRLTNAYANQFAAFVHQLDTGALYTALARVQDRIALLNKTSPKSVVLASLLDKAEQLQTELALQTSNASVVRTASTATQTEPQPVRNGILAVLLGLVLGIALAFLREALDTRVKTAAEVGAILRLPLLARIPRAPRRIRLNDRIVMLAGSDGPYAEPYRMLRTNLEFANLDHKAKTIMITSALEQEGKSTTAANLAVALAKAGKKVALVDLDLRRPFINRFFDLKNAPGLTEVALGHVPLDSALTELVVSDKYAPMNGKPHPANTLLVLTSGQIPLDPGEFVASQALPPVLAGVAAKVEFVIVDSPPVLHVGDTLALSAVVDGIVVVTRLDLVRKRTLAELHRTLDRCPAVKLGFVAASAQADEEAGYYAYSSYGQVPWPESVPAEPVKN